MSFVRANPIGWTDDLFVIKSGELDEIDLQQSRAIDSFAGGAYTPTSLIDIGGAGIRINSAIFPAGALQLVSRAVIRHQTLSGVTATPGNWVFGSNAWVNTPATGGSVRFIMDRLSHGQSMTSVTVRMVAADAARGLLPPGTLPRFEVFRVDAVTGIATSVVSATDPFTSEAAYEAPHDITTAPFAHTIDLTGQYYELIFTGESGGNSFAGDTVIAISVTQSCTFYPEL